MAVASPSFLLFSKGIIWDLGSWKPLTYSRNRAQRLSFCFQSLGSSVRILMASQLPIAYAHKGCLRLIICDLFSASLWRSYEQRVADDETFVSDSWFLIGRSRLVSSWRIKSKCNFQDDMAKTSDPSAENVFFKSWKLEAIDIFS